MTQFAQVLIPSQVITSTISSVVNNVPPLTHGQIIITVSAVTGGSITPSIEGYDPASASWYSILTVPAISTVSQHVYQIGPSFVTSGTSFGAMLPMVWRVTLTSSSANLTASVGANLAP